jgi:hypothetical protein
MRLAVTAVVLAAGPALGFGADAQVITIHAYPSIARLYEGVIVSGTIGSAKTGQRVSLESKTCGARSFQPVASLRTTAGGAWGAEMQADTRTVFRANWSGAQSREVVVLARPHLVLGQMSQRLFRAILQLGTNANGKRLLLQRFDIRDRVWRTVRAIVFRSTSSGWPQMSFPATVPSGTLLRLTLPRAEAGPCYLAGYSNLLRT